MCVIVEPFDTHVPTIVDQGIDGGGPTPVYVPGTTFMVAIAAVNGC